MDSLKIENWQTENGISVYFMPRHEIPMLEVHITFDAGSYHDAYQYGVSQLTNIMLNQGTKSFNTLQIAKGFEEAGAQFSLNSDRDMAVVSLRSLTKPKYISAALRIFSEILGKPNFPKNNFLRKKNLVLNAILFQEQVPEAIAKNALMSELYGDHPYAHSVLGTSESVEDLTIVDLRNFHKKYYVNTNASIILVGDITRSKAETLTNQLAMSIRKGEPADKILKAPRTIESAKRSIPFPSKQAHILIGQIGVNYADNDYFPLLVGNQILGGSPLISRLFRNIRRAHGLAYNILSTAIPLKANGPFIVMLQSSNQEVERALKFTNKILNDFIAKGPTRFELAIIKKKIINGFPLNISSNADVSNYMQRIGFYHLSNDYLIEYCERIGSVTVKQITEAFQKKMPISLFNAIIVGHEQ